MTTHWKPASAFGCPRVHPHRPMCLRARAQKFPFALSGPFVSKSTHFLKRSVSWPWKNNEAYSASFWLRKGISPVTNTWVLQRDSQEEPELGIELFSPFSDPGKLFLFGWQGEEILVHFTSCVWSGCLYLPHTCVSSFSNVGMNVWYGWTILWGWGWGREGKLSIQCVVPPHSVSGNCGTKCSQASLPGSSGSVMFLPPL